MSASVFLCSPTNSTMFTTCCEAAICEDQANCPRCGQEVYPGADTTSHQRSMSRWSVAYTQRGKKGLYGNWWPNSALPGWRRGVRIDG